MAISGSCQGTDCTNLHSVYRVANCLHPSDARTPAGLLVNPLSAKAGVIDTIKGRQLMEQLIRLLAI